MTARIWPPRQHDDEPPARWQDLARCAEVDPALFFPEKGGSVRGAKRVCHSCEVREECLAYALDNELDYGVWGGLSEQERRHISPLRLAA